MYRTDRVLYAVSSVQPFSVALCGYGMDVLIKTKLTAAQVLDDSSLRYARELCTPSIMLCSINMPDLQMQLNRLPKEHLLFEPRSAET